MALADYAAYQTGIAVPTRARRYKALSVNTVSNGPWGSVWRNAQDAAAIPTTADNALNGASAGALFAAVQAVGTPRLAQVEGSLAIAGCCILCDRLAHQGGLSGIVTTAQTTNLPVGPSSTRATTGAGVYAALEIYTNIGNTASTATVSYTSEAGTSGRTSPPIVFGGANSRNGGQFFPIPLQEGDGGVRSVESVTLAATTGTAGNFGVTLYRPLAVFGAGLRGQQFLWDAIHGGSGNLVDVTGICPFLLYYFATLGAGDGVFEFRFLDT